MNTPPPLDEAPAISILFIEDCEEDIYFFNRLLGKIPEENLIIYLAQSLESALAILKSVERLDLVILDLNLPDSPNPIETIQYVRKCTPLEIPIVALTGSIDEEKIHVSLEHGADDFLIKQELTEETLFRSLRSVLPYAKSQVILEAEIQAVRRKSAEVQEEMGKSRAIKIDEITNGLENIRRGLL